MDARLASLKAMCIFVVRYTASASDLFIELGLWHLYAARNRNALSTLYL